MTGRGASIDDEQEDHGRGSGRLLLVAALALALVAAAVLVLSDSARMLRLAVVAALWAALVGAFLAAKYRKQVSERDDEVADLQSVYELELEREVAARREYELEIESEMRKRVDEESRSDIEALRQDLRTLKDNLEALLGGGDVLVERVALRAESTRLRSLTESASRLTSGPEKRVINAKPIAAAPVEKPSERTELIERVAHDAKVQPPRREAARPEPTRPEPTRNSPRPQPAVVRREPVKPKEPVRAPQRPGGVVAARINPGVAAPQAQAQMQRTERVPRPQPLAPQPQARTESVARPPAVGKKAEVRAPEVASPERRSRVAERTEIVDPAALASRTGGSGRRRADERAPERPAERPVERSVERSAEQESGSWETLKPGSSGSGARRTASEDSLVSLPPSGRRAPEESSARIPAVSTGRRAAPEDSSARLPAVSGGRRAAPEDASGAHVGGKSVSELLASLGGGDAPRRRRRRED